MLKVWKAVTELSLPRPGRVITMAAKIKNKSQLFFESRFTWLNNLKFVQRRKSFLVQLNIHLAAPWRPHPSPTAPIYASAHTMWESTEFRNVREVVHIVTTVL